MAGEKKSEFVFENNSLDWCRLFAAVQIAVSHFLALMLISYQEPGMLDVRLWSVRKMFTVFPGLILLFSISGFLMGHSLESGSDRKRFLRRRLLRVYPGLWANVAVTAVLIVGILRPSAENLKSLIVWTGVQAVGVAYTPHFLEGLGTGSVNGTLWTIMVEMQFYLLLFLFWDFWRKRKRSFWLVCFCLSAAGNLLCGFVQASLPSYAALLLERSCLPYLVWFLGGFCLYQYRERIMGRLIRVLPALWIFYVAYRVLWQKYAWPVAGYYEDIAVSLLLPCLTVGTAYALGRHRRKNDISYGIFLYHWLIINVFFCYDLPARVHHAVLLAVYCLLFCLFGSASWFLLERRALGK